MTQSGCGFSSRFLLENSEVGSAPIPHSTVFSILGVEDEDMIAMNLQDLLEEAGYQVVGPVATVRAALALLNLDLPDACVLDVNLRGELSTPVAQWLKERGVPFLLSSAYRPDFLRDHVAFDEAINIGKLASPDRLLTVLASTISPKPE